MATAQEIEKMLVDVSKAATELKSTISEAHQARKELLDAQKKHRNQITELIVKEVTAQVGEIAGEARAEMKAKIGDTIDQITADWRRQLRLDG